MLKIELGKLKGLQINMLMHDCDFLGKSLTSSESHWWAAAGEYVPYLLHFLISLFIKFIVKNNIVDINPS